MVTIELPHASEIPFLELYTRKLKHTPEETFIAI
jgi:hypothetical protein